MLINATEKLLAMIVLRSYFRSGWVFLIPYLAAYLLYAWLELPVNSSSDSAIATPSADFSPSLSDSPSSGRPPSSDLSPPTSSAVSAPPLLHIYWALHTINAILAVLALRSWFKSTRLTQQSHGLSPPSSSPGALRLEKSAIASALLTLAPWACLALLFYIPGIYLEWPSDQWEHLRRINEWNGLDQVMAHSSWKKSGYFLPYSLTGQTRGFDQLGLLNLYYTAVCLLLSWQYFRLARATGLGGQASFICVLLGVLASGNNMFSFHRYYGLSTTIIAQIGAIALTRSAIETARCHLENVAGRESLPALSCRPWGPHTWIAAGGSVCALLALIALNHVQGVAIAFLGLGSVILWYLIEGRRTRIFWVIAIAAALSAVAIAARSAIIPQFADYRGPGWLSAWYGFNLLQPSSPAFERAMEIIGLIGLLNLFAGLWLLYRNSLVGWLSIMPGLALSMPFVALPYLHALIASDQPIVVFHRLLLATPIGLALVTVAVDSGIRRTKVHTAATKVLSPGPPTASSGSERVPYSRTFAIESVVSRFKRSLKPLRPYALILGCSSLLVIPPGWPNFNRIYNVLSRVPNDLAMHHVLAVAKDVDDRSNILHSRTPFIATTGVSFVANCVGLQGAMVPTTRYTFAPPRDKMVQSEILLNTFTNRPVAATLVLQAANQIYTPMSLTGYLSGHWAPLEVAFEHSFGPEMEEKAFRLDYRKIEINGTVYYVHP